MKPVSPNNSDSTNIDGKPEKPGSETIKPVTGNDNKIIEKRRLMEGQGFSLSDVDTNEIAKARTAPMSPFQLVDDGAVVAASKKSDVAALKDRQPEPIKPGEIEVDPGVSARRKTEVEHWWQKVPPYLREAVLDNHCKCRIIVNVNLTPDLQREARDAARGHNETVDQLPMFYSPSLRKIIFVDKASHTPPEQKIQKNVDTGLELQKHGGVQNYGDGPQNYNNFDVKSLSYAPIERNGWHELGHALDQTALKKFSAGSEYNKALQEGTVGLNAADKKDLAYFLTNKDEMFAEIFAIEHITASMRTHRDKVISEHFGKLIKLMHDTAKVKDREGKEHAIF